MKTNSKPSSRRGRVAWLLALGALCGAGFTCSAATLSVSTLADSGPGSLRQQIANAASGDTDRQTTRDQLWHERLRGGGERKSFEAQQVSEHVGRAGRAGLEVEPTAGARRTPH